MLGCWVCTALLLCYISGSGLSASEADLYLPKMKSYDFFVEPDDATCPGEGGTYTVLKRDRPHPSCTQLMVIPTITCRNAGASCVSKKSCGRIKDSYICVQVYTRTEIAFFCANGFVWSTLRIPSSCACYRIPKQNK
ncbi:unnamed protein product [Owenia fusiformis]|uniref:Uncharacterized protein n=1 Tax=Owenia fusiformis TaxID=6347 RepID=A0A8S4PX01_OWEFU|nr:unnamed protein product [Owenia fusiformis]